MDWKIIFSPQAISDLEAVVRYIARNDPIVAERIGNELIDRVEILTKHPLAGVPYPRRPGVRKLVSRPYVIFYRPRLAENVVDILRYWHGAQADPNLI